MSPELIRVRFAHFVERALDSARYRGMTDKDIEAATGVRSSTFHRWRRGDVRSTPGLDKVRAFCEGIGVPVEDALKALGMSADQRTNPAPEAPMPPEIREIMQMLLDPNVSATDKVFIDEALKMLADRAERARHRRKDA